MEEGCLRDILLHPHHFLPLEVRPPSCGEIHQQ